MLELLGPRIPHHDIHGRHFYNAARAGLAPFKAKIMNAVMSYEIDHHGYMIVVMVEFKGGARLRVAHMVSAYDFQNNLDEAIATLSKNLFEGFRYRESFDIPPNVVLGDN